MVHLYSNISIIYDGNIDFQCFHVDQIFQIPLAHSFHFNPYNLVTTKETFTKILMRLRKVTSRDIG